MRYVAYPQIRKLIEEYEERTRSLLPILKKTDLVCPICNDTDHNNTYSGVPWCFRCNVALSKKGDKRYIKSIPKEESHKKLVMMTKDLSLEAQI